MSVHFEITGENADFKRKLEESRQAIVNSGRAAEETSDRIGASFQNSANNVNLLTKSFIALGGAVAVRGFFSQMFRIRAEFQDTETIMTTFLGSAEKAQRHLNELLDYGNNTIFNFSELTKASQELIRFGTDVDDVIPIIDRLSNIAAATGKSLADMTNMFGMAKGGDVQRSLRDLQRAGIDVIGTLEEMGIYVDQKSIKFEHLEKVIEKVTSEGGRFHGVMAGQMDNLSTAASNFQNNIEVMFNELGQRFEPMMKRAIDFATVLVDNYETIGRAIIGLVGTYGAYRAALIATTAAKKINMAVLRAMVRQKQANAAANVVMTKSELAQAATTNVLTAAKGRLTAALAILNKTALANPFVFMATAGVALGTALWTLRDRTDAATRAKNNLRRASEQISSAANEERGRIRELIAAIQDDTLSRDERNRKIMELQQMYPDIFKNLSIETARQLDLADALRQVAEQQEAVRQQAILSNRDRAANLIDNANGMSHNAWMREATDLLGIGRVQAEMMGRQAIVRRLREHYEAAVQKIESEAAAQVVSEANDPVAIIRNREYWERMRSNAEEARARMDKSEAGSDKWNELTRQIEEANQALETWSDRVDNTDPNIELQRIIDAETRIIEQKRRTAEESKRIDFELRQSEINLLQEGFEKRALQIELDLERELHSIEQRRIALIQANTDIARAQWEQSDKGGVFDRIYDLTKEQTEDIQRLRDAANARAEHQTQQMLDNLLLQYQTFEEQRNAIIERFAKEREFIESNNADGQFDANIEVLNERMNDELVRLDIQAQDTTKIISRMFADMSQKSIEDLREIHAEAQRLLAFLSSGEWDEALGREFGLTRERFNDISGDPQQMAQMTNRVEDLGRAVWDLLTPLEQVRVAFDALLNPTEFMSAAEAFNVLENAVRNYAEAVSFVSGLIRSLGEMTDNQRLQDLADSLNTAVELANTTMQGARIGMKLGGPIGAAVGAVAGLAKGIFQASARARESARQAQEELQRFNDAVERGERNHQALLRERLRLVQQIGETDLQYQQRITEELRNQKRDIGAEFDAVMAQLHREQYVSGQRTERHGGFLGIGRRTRVVDVMGGLNGKTFEELEQLFKQGRLSDRAADLFQQLNRLREEGANVEQMYANLQEQFRQTVTGTTDNSILNGIIQGFRDGKRSAVDFADSFEELMQGALLAALTTAGEEEIREFYERFAAKAADGGLTEADIAALRAEYKEIIERLARQAEQIEKVTGEVIGQTRGGVTGELQQAMTEGSAMQIIGLFNMMTMDLREFKNAYLTDGENAVSAADIYVMIQIVREISFNTRVTAENTYWIKGMADDISTLKTEFATYAKKTKTPTSRG